jgi:restriction system protein
VAEVTRKRVGELLKPLFQLLIANGDEGIKAQKIIAELISKVELTKYEKGFYPSGGQRVDKIIRFATIDCVKAGWMIKAKGKWYITEEGKKADATFSDPEAFYKEAVKKYAAWRKGSLSGKSDEIKDEIESDESDSVITLEKAEENAWAEINEYIKKINPYEFQDIIGDLLSAMGYFVSWISPPGKDNGVDIIAWNDALGTKPPRIKVQVKRYTDKKVDVYELRSFLSLLGDDDVGIIVTSSSFTKEVEVEARTQERRKITLIDCEKLFDLWVDNYHKLSDIARRKMPIKPVWFLSLNE